MNGSRGALPVVKLTQIQFDMLDELPQGNPEVQRIGVMWKRRSQDDEQTWLVGEYVRHPTQGMGMRHSLVEIVEEPVREDPLPAFRDPNRKAKRLAMEKKAREEAEAEVVLEAPPDEVTVEGDLDLAEPPTGGDLEMEVYGGEPVRVNMSYLEPPPMPQIGHIGIGEGKYYLAALGPFKDDLSVLDGMELEMENGAKVRFVESDKQLLLELVDL